MSDAAPERRTDDTQATGAGLHAGLVFLAIGLVFAIASREHEFGSPDEIGPGYMPMVLSGMLIALGLAQIAANVAHLRDALPRIDRRASRAVLCVTLALVLFAVTVKTGGLVVAVPLLVAVAACAEDGLSWTAAAITAVVLTVLVSVVFVLGFGVNLPILPVLG